MADTRGYNNMDTGAQYQSSQWLEKQQAGSRRSKWLVRRDFTTPPRRVCAN